MSMGIGVSLILSERQRQQWQCGWTRRHDRESHTDGELARQALALLMLHCGHLPQSDIDNYDDFDLAGKQKFTDYKSRIRRLTVVGALVAAELDRLSDEVIDTAEKQLEK